MLGALALAPHVKANDILMLTKVFYYELIG